MSTTKSLAETIIDLRAEESQLNQRIAALRTESGKLKLQATKGDANAANRLQRTERSGRQKPSDLLRHTPSEQCTHRDESARFFFGDLNL